MTHQEEKNKEEIYDAQISPLMTQIIAICKEHKIAAVASFAIPIPEDDGLCCTTVLLSEDMDPPEQFLKARDALYEKLPFFAITVTSPAKENR